MEQRSLDPQGALLLREPDEFGVGFVEVGRQLDDILSIRNGDFTSSPRGKHHESVATPMDRSLDRPSEGIGDPPESLGDQCGFGTQASELRCAS